MNEDSCAQADTNETQDTSLFLITQRGGVRLNCGTSPRVEVKALPGDVDDSNDQGQLPGFSRTAAYKWGRQLMRMHAPDNLQGDR